MKKSGVMKSKIKMLEGQMPIMFIKCENNRPWKDLFDEKTGKPIFLSHPHDDIVIFREAVGANWIIINNANNAKDCVWNHQIQFLPEGAD